MKRRIVVTGLGVVSPIGLTARETWANALAGKSGVSRISLFDPTDCSTLIAAEVKGFDVSKTFSPLYPRGKNSEPLTMVANSKDARRVGRFCHFGMVAGVEAYIDSGLDAHRDALNSDRMGVNIGAGMGGLPEIEDVHNALLEKGYKRITPFFIPQTIPNMPSGQLSILLNLRGPNMCNVTACSSSAHSIGESALMIERGDADVMLAGGAEAVICKLGIGGFAAMRALSTRNDAPEKASRPFDKDRDGFVMGEGGACLVLEELEHAKKRGARIYAEIVGYGLSGDAYHMTSPSVEGEGGARAMKMALNRAGIKSSQVGYINAHGTSTPAGDPEESHAIKNVFPEAASHLHVSSTKSMTGHLLGAAGAIEAFFSVMSVFEDKIPPTINVDELDPACATTGLNFTPNKMVAKTVNYALSNSFGFGGTNASLIVGKYLGKI